MKLKEGSCVEVVSAELAGDCRLQLRFSDGQERIVDFGPFLQRSLNPLIRAYLDDAKFRQFKIENGDLQWNDYDLCFPVADLYENCIER